MADEFEILKRFDELPADAIVSTKVTAIVLNTHERTLRRSPPIHGESRHRRNVPALGLGTLAFTRGGNPQTAA
jgi:hypothetical protein